MARRGCGVANWPVVMRPTVFMAPVDIKPSPKDLAAVRFSSANFTRSMICLSGAGGGYLEVVDHALGQRRDQRGGAVRHRLARYPPGQRQCVAGAVDLDGLLGEGPAQQVANLAQIVGHGHLVELPPAVPRPDAYRRHPVAFGQQQHLTAAQRHGVHRFRRRGRDAPDVEVAVDHRALPHRQAEFPLRRLSGRRQAGGRRNTHRTTRTSRARMAYLATSVPTPRPDLLHAARGPADDYDLLRCGGCGRRRRRRRAAARPPAGEAPEGQPLSAAARTVPTSPGRAPCPKPGPPSSGSTNWIFPRCLPG